MENMINRTYSMSDADTKPFFAATSVLASNGFHLALSRLSNNKAITAFAALLCILFTAHTHAQTLEWVKSIGGKGYDYGRFIAVDDEGNVFTTGIFSDTVDFDPGIGVFNLTAIGEKDIFIQKLDAQGNFIWAKSCGGSDFASGNSIAIDSKGNVYITGNFRDTVDFDPGIGVFNLTAVGETDIFIQKLDAQGNFIWAKSCGGSDYDGGSSIAIDAMGNVYTMGHFDDTVDFDPGIGVTNLSAIGYCDVFIQKLDAQGNFIWAKSFGGEGYDQGESFAIDSNGNVYITGYYTNTVDFDPGIGVFKLSALGETDIFIQKLDKNGNFLWAKSFGGIRSDHAYSTAVDTKGNVYITGRLEYTVDFNYANIFIQKLDAQGNLLWAKYCGGKGFDAGYSIAIDDTNNVYTTGVFDLTVDFDPGTGVANLTDRGRGDIFIQKLDADGNFIWAQSFGGKGVDAGESIVVDAKGNINTIGFYLESVDFDPGKDGMKLTAPGGRDVFILKMK